MVVRYPCGGAPDEPHLTEGDLKEVRFIRADNDDEVIPREVWKNDRKPHFLLQTSISVTHSSRAAWLSPPSYSNLPLWWKKDGFGCVKI